MNHNKNITKYPSPSGSGSVAGFMGFIPMLLLVLMLVSAPFCASYAWGGVIEASAAFYVTDEANVISSDTEQYIIEKNAQLEALCGGQIVVATVDFLDGMDIEDYAYKLFADWEIGDKDKDNGVLLLLVIGEENYWCMQGKGLENTLTSGDIDDILWYYLEDDFAAGDYDAGVRSVFDALYDRVSSIYSGGSEAGASGGSIMSATNSFLLALKVAIIIIFVLAVLSMIFIMSSTRRRRTSYGGAGTPRASRPRRRSTFAPPPPRPPAPPRSSGSSRSFGSSVSRSSGSSRSSSSRSSFGGSSHSSGMSRGGGGSSRGGGAGRRGR